MHIVSGRWQLGLVLASITALMWGFLPIALKFLFSSMDPWTITFYRYISSALIVGFYLLATNKFPKLSQFTASNVKLLIVAISGLSANYIFYLWGLDYTNSSTAQVLIQLAPMLLLFSGIFFFREQFSNLQWFGFILFIFGLLLFFNKKLIAMFTQQGNYTLGVLFIIIAAITWVAYGIAQKVLLKEFSSPVIMFIILFFGSFLFMPLAEPAQIFELTNFQLWALIFSCLNTVIAYGCFAEALEHWEASRISAVVTLAPVYTVAGVYGLNYLFPETFTGETLSSLTLWGIVVVIAGAMITALGKKKAS